MTFSALFVTGRVFLTHTHKKGDCLPTEWDTCWVFAKIFPSSSAAMQISARNVGLKSLPSHTGVRKLSRLIIEIRLQREVGI